MSTLILAKKHDEYYAPQVPSKHLLAHRLALAAQGKVTRGLDELRYIARGRNHGACQGFHDCPRRHKAHASRPTRR